MMSLSINTNMASLFAQNSLSRSQGLMASAVAQLSSGLRINSSRDDASGLAISKSLLGQQNAIAQANHNVTQVINELQTMDIGLSHAQDILLRLKQLATEGKNDSLSGSQKMNIATEVNNLNNTLNNLAVSSSYNGNNLLAVMGGSPVPGSATTTNSAISSISASQTTLNGNYTLSTSTSGGGAPSITGGSLTTPNTFTASSAVGFTTNLTVSNIQANTTVSSGTYTLTRAFGTAGAFALIMQDGTTTSHYVGEKYTGGGAGNVSPFFISGISLPTDFFSGGISGGSSLNLTMTSGGLANRIILSRGNTTFRADISPSSLSTQSNSLTATFVNISNPVLGSATTSPITITFTAGTDPSNTSGTISWSDIIQSNGSNNLATNGSNGLNIVNGSTLNKTSTGILLQLSNGTNSQILNVALGTGNSNLATSLIFDQLGISMKLNWTKGSTYLATGGTAADQLATALTSLGGGSTIVVGSSGATSLNVTLNGESVTTSSASNPIAFTNSGVTLNLNAGNTISGLATALSGATLSISGSSMSGAPLPQTIQVGASTSDTTSLSGINIQTNGNGTANEMTTVGSTVATLVGYDVTTTNTSWNSSFNNLSTSIDNAVDYISSQRGAIGAQMNALGYQSQNLIATSANIEAANSTITSTDYAQATANLTKQQIMQQASTAMLAQANQSGKIILDLCQSSAMRLMI